MQVIIKALSASALIVLSSSVFADENNSQYNIVETYDSSTSASQTYQPATVQNTAEPVQISPSSNPISTPVVQEVSDPVIESEFADTYFGIQFSFDDLDLNYKGQPSSNFNLDQVGLHAGVKFTDWLSGELRYGFGLVDDKDPSPSGTANYKIGESVGAYSLVGLPLDKYLNLILPITPYAILGFTKANLEGEIASINADRSVRDWSYGVGVNYQVLDNLSASLEYISYIDQDAIELDGINLRMSYKF